MRPAWAPAPAGCGPRAAVALTRAPRRLRYMVLDQCTRRKVRPGGRGRAGGGPHGGRGRGPGGHAVRCRGVYRYRHGAPLAPRGAPRRERHSRWRRDSRLSGGGCRGRTPAPTSPGRWRTRRSSTDVRNPFVLTLGFSHEPQAQPEAARPRRAPRRGSGPIVFSCLTGWLPYYTRDTFIVRQAIGLAWADDLSNHYHAVTAWCALFWLPAGWAGWMDGRRGCRARTRAAPDSRTGRPNELQRGQDDVDARDDGADHESCHGHDVEPRVRGMQSTPYALAHKAQHGTR